MREGDDQGGSALGSDAAGAATGVVFFAVEWAVSGRPLLLVVANEADGVDVLAASFLFFPVAALRPKENDFLTAFIASKARNTYPQVARCLCCALWRGSLARGPREERT